MRVARFILWSRLFVAGVVCMVAQAGPLETRLPNSGNPEVTEGTLRHWLDTIRPSPDELKWQAVPWRARFWDAVIEAQEADKPVLLWAMNGHPLGCT